MRIPSLPLALLLAGSIAAWAQPPAPPVYAVGEIRVLGGNEIFGNPKSVLLDRAFGPGCTLPQAELRPLAASLGANVRLQLRMIGCPQGGPPPEFSCQAKVDGLSSEVTFKGWGKHLLPLPLPQLTGQSKVEISCQAAGQPTGPLPPSVLYLTFQPPLKMVSPPYEDWYRQATSWGAGLDAQTKEDKALAKMVDGLYMYGQSHWRYGYCQIEGANCVFPPGGPAVPRSTPDLECFPEYHVCRCTWEGLVKQGGTCNFGDCFMFSDTLQYIAAVMGICGLSDLQVTGNRNQGLATLAGIRSFDPDFPGNYTREGCSGPCSYLFFNHDLRTRGKCPGSTCKIFDATFGQVYSNLDDMPIASATEWNLNVSFPRSLACFLHTGYGLFLYYRGVNPSQLCPLTGENPGATFTDTPPQLLAGSPGSLEIGVDVQILQPGSYRILGVLYAEIEGRWVVVPGPNYRLVSPLSFDFIQGSAGVVRQAKLFFSGLDLEMPTEYYLNAVIENQKASGVLSAQRWAAVEGTPTVAASGRPVEILAKPPHVEWLLTEGEPRPHQLEIVARVWEPGEYLVEARLFSGTSTLAYSSEAIRLERGEVKIPIELPGREIPALGTDTEYLVTVTVHHREPLYPVDSSTFEIGRYRTASSGRAQR
jgi:hypothetical protein